MMSKGTNNLFGLLAVVLLSCLVLLGIQLKADYLSVDIGNTARHAKHLGELNEDNNWLGVGVHYEHTEDLSIGLEVSRFTNSFYDDTKFYTVTTTYTPLGYKEFEFGIQLSLGYQEGYSNEGIFMNKCEEGDNCSSFLVVPSLYGQLDNFYISVTGVPDALVATRFGFKAIEW